VAMTRRSERGDDAERCPPAGAPRGTKGEAERVAREIVETWVVYDSTLDISDPMLYEAAVARLERRIAAALERHQGASGGLFSATDAANHPLIRRVLLDAWHDLKWYRANAKEHPRHARQTVEAIETVLGSVASSPESGAAPDGDGRETPACEHCGLPLTCNASLHEEIEGYQQMFDENIEERDRALYAMYAADLLGAAVERGDATAIAEALAERPRGT
jgi:hypothetical protein